MSPEIPEPGARRLRRLRRSKTLREAVADVRLAPHNLIYPMFVSAADAPVPVASMPGVEQLPVDHAVETVRALAERGLRHFLFFGVTPQGQKDADGTYAASAEAPVNRLLAALAGEPDILAIADLCFCEYTDHGHCGVLHAPEDPWIVDNDRTLAALAAAAVAQARAGADMVAPSGMMDGQVAAIRMALDGAGFSHVAILAYSVKYASALYGPFREAGEGKMQFGDRAGYQMDFRRSREWQDAVDRDVAEGADIVMVKPAVTCLDVIRRVRDRCSVPVAAYHVSGEYAMLHAAAERGWVDLRSAAVEQTLAIRRAGADLIVTYFAPQCLDWFE